MSAKRLLEMTQAWHDCEVELKQLRALLQLRGKQTEVMKGKSLHYKQIMLNCDMSCSVPSVKDILIQNNPEIYHLGHTMSFMYWDRRVCQKHF